MQIVADPTGELVHGKPLEQGGLTSVQREGQRHSAVPEMITPEVQVGGDIPFQ